MSDAELSIGEWFAELARRADLRAEYLSATYEALETTGRLRDLLLKKYRCQAHGCTLAVVYWMPDCTALHTGDYKLSPGLNVRESVPAAREKNTVDGYRRWPGHDYDVEAWAEYGDQARIPINCDHYRGTLKPSDILEDVSGVRSGKPTRPTLL